MTVIGTNQPKNIVTPSGQRKSGVYTWGDTGATWGDATATWGNFQIIPSNQSKTPSSAVTVYSGTPMGLLLTLTYSSDFTVGSGVTNQAKS